MRTEKTGHSCPGDCAVAAADARPCGLWALKDGLNLDIMQHLRASISAFLILTSPGNRSLEITVGCQMDENSRDSFSGNWYPIPRLGTICPQTTYGMHELKAEAFGLPLVFVFIIHSD
jgi:hypothetical protein